MRGRLQQSSQGRRFEQRHVLCRLPKVFLGSRIYPIDAGAEIDSIEIERQDLVLAVGSL